MRALTEEQRQVLQEGAAASRSCDSDPTRATNPYKEGTANFLLWRWGWNSEWQEWYGSEARD